MTINLQEGLEAWYDFGSDYFDSQRGEIEDKSGYGRHAEVSGGPTVGVSGPAGFEATSLDGVDDEFSVDLDGIAPRAATTYVSYYVDDNADGGDGPLGTSQGFWEVNHFDKAYHSYPDAGNQSVNFPKAGDTGVWTNYFLVWDLDEDILACYTADGEAFDSEVPAGDQQTTLNTIVFGKGFDFLNGRIVNGGFWSRRLSPTEMNHIGNLTGPRRAML